jgi:hypothetical protein
MYNLQLAPIRILAVSVTEQIWFFYAGCFNGDQRLGILPSLTAGAFEA